MAKRGRPTTAEQCRDLKPQGDHDRGIVHCIRRAFHKGPHSNGAWKWDTRVLEGPVWSRRTA